MPTSTQQPEVLKGILLAAYVASFLFPALYYGKDHYGRDKEVLGIQVLVDGFQRLPQWTSTQGSGEDRVKASLHLAAGLANPLMWLALYAFFTQRWLPACLLAVSAFFCGLFAVGLLFKGAISERLGLGCYLWLASMLALTIMANMSWRCSTRGG
jgi:hypothetical protein